MVAAHAWQCPDLVLLVHMGAPGKHEGAAGSSIRCIMGSWRIATRWRLLLAYVCAVTVCELDSAHSLLVCITCLARQRLCSAPLAVCDHCWAWVKALPLAGPHALSLVVSVCMYVACNVVMICHRRRLCNRNQFIIWRARSSSVAAGLRPSASVRLLLPLKGQDRSCTQMYLLFDPSSRA